MPHLRSINCSASFLENIRIVSARGREERIWLPSDLFTEIEGIVAGNFPLVHGDVCSRRFKGSGVAVFATDPWFSEETFSWTDHGSYSNALTSMGASLGTTGLVKVFLSGQTRWDKVGDARSVRSMLPGHLLKAVLNTYFSCATTNSSPQGIGYCILTPVGDGRWFHERLGC